MVAPSLRYCRPGFNLVQNAAILEEQNDFVRDETAVPRWFALLLVSVLGS